MTSLNHETKVCNLDEPVCGHDEPVCGLDEADEPKVYTLISSDDIKVEISEKALKLSPVLVAAFEQNNDLAAKIPRVNARALYRCVQYMEYYKDADIYTSRRDRHIPQKPLPSYDLRQLLTRWDYAFVDVDLNFLIEMIRAANYLGVKNMLSLLCAKMVTELQGDTPGEIDERLGVELGKEPQMADLDEIEDGDTCEHPTRHAKMVYQKTPTE